MALVSDAYLASQWCFAEIALARMEGKEIFALQIEGLSAATSIPSILLERQMIDLRSKPDEAYARLFLGFEALGITAEDRRTWSPTDPPYPGLRAFEERDAPIFFGREGEVTNALEQLNRVARVGSPRLVMVLGSSGSGKSSLVRAGILPKLRQSSDRYVVVGPLRPGASPARSVASQLTRAFRRLGVSQSSVEIARRLDALTPVEYPIPLEGDDEDSGRAQLLAALKDVADDLLPTDESVLASVRRLKEHLEEQPVEGEDEPAIEAPASEPATESVVFADDATDALTQIAEELVQATDAQPKVLLILDQFEELLGHDERGKDAPANRFLALLKAALDNDESPLLVLATMRSDYLGELQRARHFAGVGFKSLSVGPMSEAGMRQVITGPAQLGAIELEAADDGKLGLVEQLLVDTGTSDALPLLAFTLRTLWEKYVDIEAGDRIMELSEYEDLGGLQGAVAKVADETADACRELGSTRELQHAFLALTRPAAEGSGWARRPAQWDEFSEQARPMLQRFIDQRLLIKHEDDSVEVAHEALFRSWGTLRGWLQENAEALTLLREIQDVAEKWQAATTTEDRDDFLWSAGRLSRALELRDEGVLRLDDTSRGFIDASEDKRRAEVEAERRRQQRKQRLTIGVAAGAVLAAVVAVLLSIRAHDQRIEAENQEVLSRADSSIHLYQARQPFEALRVAVTTGAELEQIDEDDRSEGVQERVETALLQALSGVTLKNVWRAHDAWPNVLVACDSGEPLVSAGYDAIIRRWRRNGTQLPPLVGHESPIFALAVNSDGRRIVSGDQGGSLFFWRDTAQEPQKIVAQAHPTTVLAIAFHPSGQLVASASNEGPLLLWSHDGSRRVALRDDMPLASLTFSVDGTELIGGEDCSNSHDECGRVFRWRRTAGAPLLEAETWQRSSSSLMHSGTVHTVAASVREGGAGDVLSGGADGTVAISGANGERSFSWDGESPIYVVGDVAQGTRFAVGADQKLRIWHPDDRLQELPAHEEPITGLVLRGKYAATIARDLRLKVWNIAANPHRVTFHGHSGSIQEIDVQPQGELIASASDDRTVRLWKLDGTQKGPTLRAHENLVRSVRFHPNGELVASGGHDGRVVLWDIGSGASRELEQRTVGVNSVDFTPDGEHVLAASLDGRVALLGTEDGSPPREILPARPTGTVWGARMFGKDKIAVFGPELPRIQILTLDGVHLLELEDRDDCGHVQGVIRAVLSADGQRIASAAGAGNAVLWDGEGRCLKVLTGHGRGANFVDFTADGRQLVTAGLNGAVRIWDAATGSLVRTLLGQEGAVNSVVFTPQGWIASSGTDSTINLWKGVDRTLSELLDEARSWIADHERLPQTGTPSETSPNSLESDTNDRPEQTG